MSRPSVTVIVPIYGVEKYIGRCLESLFSQTMSQGVEYIFVNDCTKDGSMDIVQYMLDKYPERKSQSVIIDHDINKGLPAARNTGFALARGEYVMHVDSDDFLEPTALEQLYGTAIAENADVVWCDYYISFGQRERVITQPSYTNPMDAVKAMLRGEMKYNVWNKLCRRALYTDNCIVFPAGHSMGEDLTMIMVCMHASRCAYIDKPLYHYVQSQTQMTSVYTEDKLSDLRHNCSVVSDYIINRFPDSNLESELSALKQLMKWPFLLDGKKSSFKRWLEWFPEANKDIIRTKGVNRRIKFIEWCAAKKLFPVVWLHYILVIRIFYGLFYK